MNVLPEGLHVGRFRARHHAADEAGRRRAQAAQQRLLEGGLEAALARVAGPDELVLVRRLSARVVLGAAGSEHDDARAWGDALLLGLERALQHAGPQALLRFATPQQALRRFAVDALQDRSTHDWAWQRLGLLPATATRQNSRAQRRQALLHRLADDAAQSVPLLRSLMGSPQWPVLLLQLHEDELRGLAQTVLARLAGTSAARFEAGADPLRAPPVPAPAGDAQTEAAAAVPAWWPATRQAAGAASRARWALRLAAMLSAPALARRGALAVDTQLQRWAASVDAAASTGMPALPRGGHGATATLPVPGEAPPAGAPATAKREAASPAAAMAVRAPAPAAAAARHAPPAATAAPAQAGEEDAGGRTRHGGMLFLVPLLPACGVLPLLEDTALWPELPPALHALALQLAPLAADDPAALAFCGLAPQQPPPRPLPASPERQACLQAAQERLLAQLAQRLPDWRCPGLLARVLLRDARISADPGWIDVHLSLRDVAIELRRAALDLDPGFLPWLGVVMRFRYE